VSAPKKPGTDLSALKAKLAKKGPEQAAPAPAAQAAAPVAAAAPPAAAVPPPGQKAAPPAAAAAPAGTGAGPAVDLPAPGEVRKAAPAAAPAAPAKPAGPAGAAFAGAGASFDPNEGLIADVGGDIASKSNKGVVIIAAAGALLFGLALGWIGSGVSAKRALVATGSAKGAEMLKEVQAVSDMRKDISLAIDEIPKKIEADPKAGAEAIKKINSDNFEKAPKVDKLFGWQLAAVHGVGIKKTFELYEEANALRTDLAYLANFVDAYAAAIKEGSGPRRFAIKFVKGKTILVSLDGFICGEAECQPGQEKNATAYLVREAVGGEPAAAPAGTEEGQVTLVDPEGGMYQYVVGLRPENYAAQAYSGLFGRVKGRLEEMATAEKRALKALQNYSDNPDVDGSGQPEPGE
jgi:hypothetical protein